MPVADQAWVLAATAAALGVVHTLLGPDHYLPFIALARARRWTLPRTLAITAACGLGHVAGSVALGVAAILAGAAVLGLDRLESLRGEIAGWLLLGLGLAYTVWGLRGAWRDRPHTHLHVHADGTVHRHEHRHRAEHAHVHAEPSGRHSLTPWALFLIFVLGPCEPLIPLLMVPAAGGGWTRVWLVAAVFGLFTLATMTAAVAAGCLGLARLPLGRLEPYSHVLAGLAVVACGLAARFGL